MIIFLKIFENVEPGTRMFQKTSILINRMNSNLIISKTQKELTTRNAKTLFPDFCHHLKEFPNVIDQQFGTCELPPPSENTQMTDQLTRHEGFSR